jgi:hypothetical protein
VVFFLSFFLTTATYLILFLTFSGGNGKQKDRLKGTDGVEGGRKIT